MPDVTSHAITRTRSRRVALRALAAGSLVLASGAGGAAWAAVPALAAAPVVSSFSPATGTIGTQVTVTGSGFTGASKVTFGNPAAASQFTVGSDTTITAAVPALASTGKVSVTTSAGTTASTAKFTVTPGLALSAQSGHPAGTVTVSGAGFGAFEAVDLFFDTADQALASANGTGNFSGISIAVPAWAAPGTHWVTAVGRHSGFSAQAPYTVSTNWPQRGFSARHKGVNPFENVLSPFTVAGIDMDWSFTTGDAVESSPAVANGTVYAGSDDGKVYALNAATGTKLWSFTTGSNVESSPAVVNGTVYVGSNDHLVYALNAATGTRLWSRITGSFVTSSPTVANGTVYVGSDDGKVYAINAATGGLVWSFATGDAVESSPAVVNGTVYAGSTDHKVYALNAATGALVWSFATGGVVESSPAVVNGTVYAGSFDNNVYALNAATGAMLWSFATGDPVASSPAVANGAVYVGSGDHSVYAFDLAGGTAVARPIPGQLHPDYSLRPQRGTRS